MVYTVYDTLITRSQEEIIVRDYIDPVLFILVVEGARPTQHNNSVNDNHITLLTGCRT